MTTPEQGNDPRHEDDPRSEEMEGVDAGNGPDDLTEDRVRELVRDLPDEKVVELILSISRTERFSSPVPPPRILEAYEEILPGATDRIFTIVEKEQAHRHKKESTLIGRLGTSQWMALIFGLVVVISGTIIILSGQSIYGLIVLLTGVGAIMSSFWKSLHDMAERPRGAEKERH